MRRRRIPLLLFLLAVVGVMALGLAATAAAAGNRVRLEANLSGNKELPPADPDGRGEAEIVLKLDQSENNVCFDIEFERTGTPNKGHIHVGDATVNGGIVVTFFDVAANPADPLHDQLERGRAKGCVTGDPAIVSAIAANPAGYYVNLHNARFPGGAIRGQLTDD